MSDSEPSVSGQPLVRVVKLGGSLLGDAKTPQRISDWLESHETLKGQSNFSSGQESSDSHQPPQTQNIWIVGGGELVNTVRDWDAKFVLDAKSTHWTCIDLMDVNSRLLSAWFPKWPILDRYQDKKHRPSDPNQILLTSHWMRRQNSGLAESWATTSDSIAAAFAGYIQADELVLLKSCELPESISLANLKKSDIVDDQFVPLVEVFGEPTMKIRLVNLSNDLFNGTDLEHF